MEHQRPWPGSDAASSPLCRGLTTASSDASDAPSLARCSACGRAADQYSLFAVFDGHNGASAARLAAKEVVPVLEERLPQGAPPSPHSPQFTPWCATRTLCPAAAVQQFGILSIWLCSSLGGAVRRL